MELYNPIIRSVEELVGPSTPQKYPYDPADAWEDTGAFELVMLRDAAFELGGSGKSAVSTYRGLSKKYTWSWCPRTRSWTTAPT